MQRVGISKFTPEKRNYSEYLQQKEFNAGNQLHRPQKSTDAKQRTIKQCRDQLPQEASSRSMLEGEGRITGVTWRNLQPRQAHATRARAREELQLLQKTTHQRQGEWNATPFTHWFLLLAKPSRKPADRQSVSTYCDAELKDKG